MRITHKIPRNNAGRDRCDTSLCILSNSIGGFLLLSDQAISKYNGLFFNENLEPFKTLERIGLADSSPEEIENHLTHVRRRHKDNTERITFPQGANGLIYSLAKKDRIFLDFDCRRVNDLRTYGRMYETKVEGSNIILRFTKRTNENEDSTHDEEEFRLCIVIQARNFSQKEDYGFIDQWKEVFYPYDHERKDPPTSRYVYSPFIISAKDLLIGVGRTKEQALEEIDRLGKHKSGKHELVTVDTKKNPEAATAFLCAQASLESLKVQHDDRSRIFAGYPWFFQFWSRDENISLGALIQTQQYAAAKAILFSYLKSIGKDGRLPNRVPSSSLGSADGIGWFWKRVGDLVEDLKNKHLLEKYLSWNDQKELREALAKSIQKIEKNYRQDNLVTSQANETWMDTQWQGQDGRPGAAIEVQCLHLNMLRLAQDIAADEKEKKKYRTKETAMKKNVMEAFWDKSTLADTKGDRTQRPNIFIAYYAYPDLLSRREWQTAFERCLEATWLDWGGLASIAKDHPLFTNDYTGADNQSYHRGDSWYWLNNLAALCMVRNNPIEFEQKILKIINASSREILWNGAIGHHAELSSASHLSSKGCLAQAWSAAMFIELMLEAYR